MASIFLMAMLGLVLIYAEFFIPGGFLAIIGGAALLISAVGIFTIFSFIGAILFFWILLILAIAATIRLAIYRLKLYEGSVVSSASQEGYVVYDVEASLIGQQAIALTDLRPAGLVVVAGQKKSAISHLGYISKGTTVIITKAEGPDLIVREI